MTLVVVDSDRWANAAARRVLDEIRRLSPKGAKPWRNESNIRALHEAVTEIGEAVALEHVRACAEIARRSPEQWRFWGVRSLFTGQSSEIWLGLVAAKRVADERAEAARSALATVRMRVRAEVQEQQTLIDPEFDTIADPALRRLARRHVKRTPPPQMNLFGDDE